MSDNWKLYLLLICAGVLIIFAGLYLDSNYQEDKSLLDRYECSELYDSGLVDDKYSYFEYLGEEEFAENYLLEKAGCN